ncbi:MAG: TMEM165/GDT1 family protein [Thermodesulfobacteriota bacterium]|nr:TMEM165/GDT1 family protein [Thermodesulfobacteriota bacterium]
MKLNLFLTVFSAVFIAEIGDKTQLATMLFAAEKDVSTMTIFLAASAALILSSAVGVFAGSLMSAHINGKILSYIAGAGFVCIGVYTLLTA